MSAYILPVLIIFLLVYSYFKKVNTYEVFVFGAKTSFDLILISFPYTVAIFIVVELFAASGLSAMFANFISPLFNIFGIPSQLAELIIIKPFSGCGALAVLENIYLTYGVDSYIARAGSTIAGCSEAIFYVVAVYFAGTNVKKFRYAIPVALFANFIGAVVGCYMCTIM